jgi:hypothetical protein
LEEKTIVIVYTLLDPQRMSYSFGYTSSRSLTGLIYAFSRGHLLCHLVFDGGVCSRAR